jgi:hypothetical protein
MIKLKNKKADLEEVIKFILWAVFFAIIIVAVGVLIKYGRSLM